MITYKKFNKGYLNNLSGMKLKKRKLKDNPRKIKNYIAFLKLEKLFVKRLIPRFCYHNCTCPNFKHKTLSFHWLNFYVAYFK